MVRADVQKRFVSLDSEASLQTTSAPAGSKRSIDEDEVDGGSAKRVKLEPSAPSSTKGLTYMGNNLENFLVIDVQCERIVVNQQSNTGATRKV